MAASIYPPDVTTAERRQMRELVNIARLHQPLKSFDMTSPGGEFVEFIFDCYPHVVVPSDKSRLDAAVEVALQPLTQVRRDSAGIARGIALAEAALSWAKVEAARRHSPVADHDVTDLKWPTSSTEAAQPRIKALGATALRMVKDDGSGSVIPLPRRR